MKIAHWPLIVTLLVLFATCLAGGVALERLTVRTGIAPESQPDSQVEWRQRGSFRFINPLLECEYVGESLRLPEMARLQADMERLVAAAIASGAIRKASVYFRRLADGPWVGINEREFFRGASLFKVPYAIAGFRMAERDPSLLRRTLLFDSPEDANALQSFRPPETMVRGTAYTVEELLRRMLQNSDNNAALLLRQVISPAEESDVLGDIFPNYRDVPVGQTNVRDYSAAFRILYNASYLSRPSSERILAILGRSSFKYGIVAGVPPGTRVATKFGESSLEAEGEPLFDIHEFAIVYHPASHYLLGILAIGPDRTAAVDLIRDISSLVWREMEVLKTQGASGVADPASGDR
jgi:hypothetical protein